MASGLSKKSKCIFLNKILGVLFSAVFLLGSTNPVGFDIHFQSVDDRATIRLIFESNIPFKYVLKKARSRLEIHIDKEANSFETEEPSRQSIFIKNIGYKKEKGKTTIFVLFKRDFKVKESFVLKRPFRLVIDLKRETKIPAQLGYKHLGGKKAWDDINSLINKYSFLLRVNHPKEKLSSVKILLNTEAPLPSITNSEKRLTFTEANMLKNDIGLKLVGDYAYNTSMGITNADEGPYKWRIRVGLDWDIMRDGLLKRKRQKELLKKQMEIESLQETMNRRKENYYFLHNLIIYLFSNKKIRNLKQRREVLKELLSLIRKEYFTNRASIEDSIKLERDLARTENLLDNYLKYRKEFVTSSNLNNFSLTSDDLPLVDIDIDLLLREISEPEGISELFKLNRELLNLKYNLWKDIRLKLWLYHYHYNRIKKTNNFFSLGVQLNIPFPMSIQSRKEIKEAEESLFEVKYNREIHANVLEVTNAYDEYKTKLDDYINFFNKRRILQARLKRALVEHNFGAGRITYGEILGIIKQAMEVNFELYSIRQQMYLRMIKIFRYYNGNDIMKFIKPIKLENLKGEEIYKGERFLYIWSNSFNRLSNDFIIQFLQVRKIENVLISFSKGINQQKLKSFMEKAKENNINCYATFSTNEWLKKNYIEKIKARLEETYQYGFKGIHFDIEPHTFPDWDKNNLSYMENYRKLLKFLKSYVGIRYEISVTVPFHHFSTYYNSISPFTDRIFVMTYGKHSLNKDKIINKLMKLLRSEKGKIILTLRPTDFEGELEMEEFIDSFYETGMFRSFAFNDIENFLRRGQNAIKK